MLLEQTISEREFLVGSYTPLYRKYRPQKFDELVGQESVSRALSNAIKLGRVAHAYLFTGPRGTGKTSSARIFAKSLNCVEGPTVNPCGKCPNCIDIANSNSVDVIEIDAASNRKVEDARNLLEKVQFVPVSGKYKIYIIDEVHMLTPEAFNTLLKTLEEPPENLVFILATTEAHKVLNTIISRCQRFDFLRVSNEQIIQNLRKISDKEGIKIEDKALAVIAKKAYGGMRDAIGLLDQSSVLANQGKEITENDIITLLGSLSEDILYDLTGSLAQKDASRLIELISKVIQNSEPVNVIRELINYFRNLLIIKTTDNTEKIKLLINFSESILSDVKAQADEFELNEIVQIIEKLSDYEKTIKNTSQQHLWLEVALISICHRQDIQVVKDLEARIEKLEQAIYSGNVSEIQSTPVKMVSKPEPVSPPIEKPTPTPVSRTEPQAGTPASKEAFSQPELKEESIQPGVNQTVGTSSVSDPWQKVLTSISKINAPAEAFFKIFMPVELSSEKIVITCKNEKWIDKAKKEKIGLLEQGAKEVFGTSPQILIRTPLPEDEEVKKNPVEIETKPPAPNPEPPKPKQVSQIAIDTEPIQELETEVVENLEEIHKSSVPADISEQAKMVINVFNGKVID